jgi:asparagine synthase (glutamine-hydrolysing)
MCGIVGALAFRNSPFEITEGYLEKMRDSMSHRGPDGKGTWISMDRRVGLGHRRLSIIDLSEAASQPMCNEDGSLWISFNGEIYNHAEIRRELETTGGHRWKTDHSDTEVILHAFEQWGIESLRRFRGMFAFALWDNGQRELWLVRDRIGVKPLYYSIHHGRVTFASEIKALLKDPRQERAVSEESFYHYLSFLTSPATQTLFEGIRKLAGGTWLRIKENGDVMESRYWDVWDHVTPLIKEKEEDVAEQLLREIRTSVQLRKVSDVPVGVFLSGGIDSSTNVALFSEGESGPVKTFTIGYDGNHASYPDETRYARAISGMKGAEYHERLLKIDDLLDFLPQMVYHQDEPIADPVCVPVYYVSKLARENGVIVCQVGEGADELFCGYPLWQTAISLQRYGALPVPRFLKLIGLECLKWMGKEEKLYYEWLRRNAEGLPIFWSGAESFTEQQKKRLLSNRLKSRFSRFSSWEVVEPIRRRFEEKAWEKTPLQWMTYMDLNLRLPELLLMRLDKMSMSVSLEGRFPFLDHRLVEFAMSIPERMKTRNNTLKYIFKKSIKGVIPDDFITRPKQGFGLPMHEWYLDRLGDRTRRIMTDFCRETDFLDGNEVKRMLDGRNRTYVWFLLNFALWWNCFIKGEEVL